MIRSGCSRKPQALAVRSAVRAGWPGRRTWLAVLAAAAPAAAIVLVTTRGHVRHVVSAPLPSAPPLLPLLRGVPTYGAHRNLFLGGEDFWQAGRQPG